MKKEGGYFSNLNSAMLVATFFALWLAVYFEYAVEDTLAYILILSFGILHGANDIKLIQVTSLKENKKPKYIRILLYYAVFVLVVAGLFYFIPGISLLLFILFSAYHFGEQHWVDRLNTGVWEQSVFYTCYGLMIFFLLFMAHAEEVNTIIQKISGVQIFEEFYAIGFTVSVTIIVLLYAKIVRQISGETMLEIFYLLVFFIVFNTASLLWAFAIYFIIWHSIPSLSDQIRFLYGDFTKSNFLKYLRSSLIYWGIAVISLVVLFNFFDDSGAGFLPFLFSFLAAITFPHVFVIRRLNQS